MSGFLPAASRRIVVMGSVAAFVCAASGTALRAHATAPPPTPQAAAPAPAAQQDPLKFDTATPRLVFMALTADGDQAFEAALTKAKDILSKSDKPEQKQQAAHWKVLKAKTNPDGSVTLFMMLDAVVPNVSYNPFAILFASGLPPDQIKSEIQPLMDRVNAQGANPPSTAAMKGFNVFEV
ncbi:MAG TPA: hypothetical protein VIX35_13300, partial [Vicinamibacterales bacterium]